MVDEKRWLVRVRYINNIHVTNLYFDSEKTYDEFKIACTDFNYNEPALVNDVIINLRHVTTIEFCGEVQ